MSLFCDDLAEPLDGDAALDAFRHGAACGVVFEGALGGFALIFRDFDAVFYDYVSQQQLAVDFFHAALGDGFEFLGTRADATSF